MGQALPRCQNCRQNPIQDFDDEGDEDCDDDGEDCDAEDEDCHLHHHHNRHHHPHHHHFVDKILFRILTVLPHLQGNIEIGRHKDRNAEVGNTKHRIY